MKSIHLPYREKEASECYLKCVYGMEHIYYRDKQLVIYK